MKVIPSPAVLRNVKKGASRLLIHRGIAFLKDLKTVSVTVGYTTKTKPEDIREKKFTVDVEKMKVERLFIRGERNVGAYQYKIIWINEMGEEQVKYVETKEARDLEMQSLADDGYSPVWREV